MGNLPNEDRNSMTEKRSRRAFDAAFKLQVVRSSALGGLPQSLNYGVTPLTAHASAA